MCRLSATVSELFTHASDPHNNTTVSVCVLMEPPNITGIIGWATQLMHEISTQSQSFMEFPIMESVYSLSILTDGSAADNSHEKVIMKYVGRACCSSH
jgi:hypothetical protein